MKKSAVAAFVLGLSSVLSAAHAAPVTIDAASYTLTYDDSFLPGVPTVDVTGNIVTFSGATAVAASPLMGSPAYTTYGVDSYNGKPFPITLTAKTGFVITGLTETISGDVEAGVAPGQGNIAMAGAGFQSYWIANGVVQGNAGSKLLANIDGANEALPVMDTYQAGGALTLSSSAESVKLSAIGLTLFANAVGNAKAGVTVSSYKLNVQTAPVAVPEPQTYALLAAGLGVAAFSLRRRQHGTR